MRRWLILTVAVLASALASAQDNGSVTVGELFSPKVTEIRDGKGDLMRYRGALVYSDSNRYLSPSDVTGAFWRKYESARILQDYGQYIWLFGLTYMASDVTVALILGNEGISIDTGAALALGGICVLVGGAMDFWGWKKLGNLAETYNTNPDVRREYSLRIGPTRSGGFGLSLNF